MIHKELLKDHSTHDKADLKKIIFLNEQKSVK